MRIIELRRLLLSAVDMCGDLEIVVTFPDGHDVSILTVRESDDHERFQILPVEGNDEYVKEVL